MEFSSDNYFYKSNKSSYIPFNPTIYTYFYRKFSPISFINTLSWIPTYYTYSTYLPYYEHSILNHSQECQEMPNKILLAERILLQTLCFDLQLVHPYRTCVEKMNEKLKRKNQIYLRFFLIYLLFFWFLTVHFFLFVCLFDWSSSRLYPRWMLQRIPSIDGQFCEWQVILWVEVNLTTAYCFSTFYFLFLLPFTIHYCYVSYRTTLCLHYPPHQIAVGCLFLATLQLGMKPVNPNPRSTIEHTWFELLEVSKNNPLEKWFLKHTAHYVLCHFPSCSLCFLFLARYRRRCTQTYLQSNHWCHRRR